jgi:ATP-dependent protease HslVU (ClpYQ) peptidase subunit
MTTIVAVQGKNFSVVSTDSRIADVDSDGNIFQVSTLRDGASKVSQNGKYLFGAAGDLRAINLLNHAFKPPVIPSNMRGKNLDNFFTNKFIPALRRCFEMNGYSTPDRPQAAEHGSVIMVSAVGNIYIVDHDYSWFSDSSGLYAIGTGAPYALGVLHALRPEGEITIDQAKELSITALTMASKFDPYTGPPYNSFVQPRK